MNKMKIMALLMPLVMGLNQIPVHINGLEVHYKNTSSHVMFDVGIGISATGTMKHAKIFLYHPTHNSITPYFAEKNGRPTEQENQSEHDVLSLESNEQGNFFQSTQTQM